MYRCDCIRSAVDERTHAIAQSIDALAEESTALPRQAMWRCEANAPGGEA